MSCCFCTSLCVVCADFTYYRSFRSICDTCIKCYNRDSFVSTFLQCIQNRRCIACCNTDSFRVGSDCCVDHVNLVSDIGLTVRSLWCVSNTKFFSSFLHTFLSCIPVGRLERFNHHREFICFVCFQIFELIREISCHNC